MIDLYDIGDGRNTQRNVTIERCRARIEALTAQKRDIDDAIAELDEFVSLLETPDQKD